MKEFRMTMPPPRPALSPNSRVHWRTRARWVRDYREIAWALALHFLNGQKAPRWARAETQTVFYFATNRRRDGDNLAATMKAAWDGIADAGIVANDAGLTHAPPEMRLDKKEPRVEITIREV